MRVTKARVGFTMVMAWLCFGCKGAGAIAQVATAAAVVVTRAAVESGALHSGAGTYSGDEADRGAPHAPPPEPCAEIGLQLELPGDRVWVPMADCGRYKLVLDAETGAWRSRR